MTSDAFWAVQVRSRLGDAGEVNDEIHAVHQRRPIGGAKPGARRDAARTA
jgi:hypothetical protein